MAVVKIKDIVLSKFNRWTVLALSHKTKKTSYWKCLCTCGSIRIVGKQNLIEGRSKSCGCLKRELHLKAKTKLGMSRSPIYKVWHAMVQRCYNSKCRAFKNYGGRNIFIDTQWLSFEKFYIEFGQFKPSKIHSIDRIDNDGPYSKENCRWITIQEQQQNKQNTIRINGISAKKFFRDNNIPRTTGYELLKKGLKPENILRIYDERNKNSL